MPMVDPAALRAARERAGLTQHELARQVGVAGGERLSMWELGTSVPRPALLRRLAAAVGVPPAELLLEDGSEPDLRRLRWLAGLSAREAARKANVSLATWTRWEGGTGSRRPTDSQMDMLAELLGTSRESLMTAFRQWGGDHRSGNDPRE